MEYGTPWFKVFLRVLENEEVDFVVTFQEFQVELDRLLSTEDISQLVVDLFRFLP